MDLEKNLKNCIPIIYNGGSYGSFISYILECIEQDLQHVKSPFKDHGNSHKCNSIFVNRDRVTNKFFIKHDGNLSRFIRCHPQPTKNQELHEDINYLVQAVKKAILIYPSPNTILLSLNNWFTKVYKTGWWNNELTVDVVERDIFVSNLYTNWDINTSTKFEDIPRWILREFLSFYLMPAWQSQVQWNLLDWYTNPSLYVTTIEDIMYNFEKTIIDMSTFCNLHITNLDEILKVHKDMLLLQENLNKDKICNNIITNFNSDKDYTFTGLSLIDEAWIQWELRNQGYELKCNNLNKFPTTVKDLKKIAYKA
jgi:hypothetical protein